MHFAGEGCVSDTTETMTKSICNIHFFPEAHHKGTPTRLQEKYHFHTENYFSGP